MKSKKAIKRAPGLEQIPEIEMIYVKPDKPSDFGQLVRYHAQISSELPELLAKLVDLDRREEALELIVQWGTHIKANSEVWEEAKGLLKGLCESA